LTRNGNGQRAVFACCRTAEIQIVPLATLDVLNQPLSNDPFLTALPAAAQDATWLANPGSGDFNTDGNWSPAAVPTGTAVFGTSSTTNLSLSTPTTVGGFTFNPGASAYTFDNATALRFTGAGIDIQGGSATIANTSAGVVEFQNTASAGSATIANEGFVSFKDHSTAGRATIAPGSSSQFAGILFADSSTAGNATITTATTGFFGTNIGFLDNSTAGNSTLVINQGSFLAFGDNATAGAANITANLHGRVDFNGGTNAGSATISLSNDGRLTFEGASSAGNARIRVTSGTGSIGFRESSTAANATITLDVSGVGVSSLSFSQTASGGNARVISNTKSAFVSIQNLTSAGTTLGSIEGLGGFALGFKTLTVGGNNLSTIYGGNFSGTGGSLVKTGTGTLTLTGTSSTNTGSTTVDAGALVVNGSIASSTGVTVNNGATLAGGGTVRNATIAGGGTLFAGDGTANSSLKLTGSLALQSGAFYMVQFDPTTSSFANVTGTATLGGATVKANFTGGGSIKKQYSILTAGSLSGTFGALETNLASVQSSLSYDATHAYLNLALNYAGASGFSANQQSVANTLTNFFNSTGSIPLVYATLTAPGFTQASGETATGSQQTAFNAMGQFMGVMTDPFIGGRGANGGAAGGATPYADEEALAYAAGRKRTGDARDAYAALYRKAPLAQVYDPRWSVWAAGFGGSQTTDGNTVFGSNNTTSSLFGTAVGADYRFSPNTIAGFALAGGGTNFSVAGGGSGRSDLFQAGAFVRHKIGAAYVSGALAYGWQDITTDRTVMIAGIDRLRAQFNANAYSGRIEGGYRFVAPWIGGLGLTPYAAGQFTTFDLPAYAEQVVTGGNAFALAYGAQSVTNTRSELGLRADKSYAMQNAVLTLRGRLAWAHDYDPNRAAAATFQALPGASFVVNGARPAADAALTTASVEMKWLNGWSAAGTFEGEFSSVTTSYAGKGVVRYSW
jgi:autotransporter-associated beta strand protein